MPTHFQQMLQEQRNNPETAKAGLKWDQEDDDYLLKKAEEGATLDAIAKELLRTPGSIKTRLIIHSLNKIEAGENIDDVVKHYSEVINQKDISDYQKKKELQEKKKLNYYMNKNKRQENNNGSLNPRNPPSVIQSRRVPYNNNQKQLDDVVIEVYELKQQLKKVLEHLDITD